MVKSALLLDHRWCQRILCHNKTWELRSQNCKKRGRIGLATTSKSNPRGVTELLGEVTLVDVLVVGEMRHGLIAPPRQNPENYMFLRANREKHHVFNIKDFPTLKGYKKIFAWVMKDPILYDRPKALPVKRGCIAWVNVK